MEIRAEEVLLEAKEEDPDEAEVRSAAEADEEEEHKRSHSSCISSKLRTGTGIVRGQKGTDSRMFSPLGQPLRPWVS